VKSKSKKFPKLSQFVPRSLTASPKKRKSAMLHYTKLFRKKSRSNSPQSSTRSELFFLRKERSERLTDNATRSALSQLKSRKLLSKLKSLSQLRSQLKLNK